VSPIDIVDQTVNEKEHNAAEEKAENESKT
jgi:hypothetical protein